ncbi:hypothetical protein BDW62DRAFT_49044 [Aspergillus aurantiobrunneus]
MRFRIVNRLLSPHTVTRQSFHHVSAPAKEPAIFENSLEKTLEEHRSVNRESLIRKVFARSDSPTPQRPTLPNKSGLSESPESPKSQSPLSKTATQLPTFQDDSASRKSPIPIKRPNPRPPAPSRVRVYQPLNLQVTRGNRRQCPWLDKMERSRPLSSGISQLDAEIRALENYMIPTAKEIEVADKVVSDVTTLISRNTESFISPQVIRTGFRMSHSALNLLITLPDQGKPTDGIREPSASRPERLRKYHEFLNHAYRILGQYPTYESRLFGGRQGTRAVIHRPTGLVLRLYCAENQPAHTEYIQEFHAEYPTLRSLYIVIQLLLQTRGVFDGTNSSIDSNALQVLIAAFLKMNHGRFRFDTGCAESLLAFLHTFGTEVDLISTGVSVDPPGFFNADSVEEACMMHNPDDLPAYLRGQRSLINTKKTALKKRNIPLATTPLIQSPGNYMESLGRSCSQTTEMQSAFAEAHTRLKSALNAWGPSLRPSPSDSILSKAFHVDFEDYESRRASILSGSTAS